VDFFSEDIMNMKKMDVFWSLREKSAGVELRGVSSSDYAVISFLNYTSRKLKIAFMLGHAA